MNTAMFASDLVELLKIIIQRLVWRLETKSQERDVTPGNELPESTLNGASRHLRSSQHLAASHRWRERCITIRGKDLGRFDEN